MAEAWSSELTPEHAALLEEARAGIERLAARAKGRRDDLIFLVAHVDSALGRTIHGMGVPRGVGRQAIVLPLTRDDALLAAGALMSVSLAEKLVQHEGAAVLVMVGDAARLVALHATPTAPVAPLAD